MAEVEVKKAKINVEFKTAEKSEPLVSGESINRAFGKINRAMRDTAEDLSKITNSNLLDNWYFADPINQKGKTEYTGVTYTIDRWSLADYSAAKAELDNGIAVNGTPSYASYFIQRFEKPLPTGTYTLSALVSECDGAGYLQFGLEGGGLGVYSSINGTGLISVTSDTRESINRVILQANKGSKIKFLAAKLELGDHQTLAHQDAEGDWVLNDPPPNKALELEKCLRYQICGPFEVTSFDGTSALLPTPTPLRAAPTIIGKVGVYRLMDSLPIQDATVTIDRVDKNGVILGVLNNSDPGSAVIRFPEDAGLDANL